MKGIIKMLVFAIFIGSCSKSEPVVTPALAASCNTSSTPFQSAWASLNYPITTSPENLVQEYTFNVNANKTVCSIGYQGTSINFTTNTPYTIEIYNNTTSTMVYTGNLIFNSASVDYKTITPAVLMANESYTIRRIAPITNASVYGPGPQSTSTWKNFTAIVPVFPIVSNGLTITGSKIYNGNLSNLCTNCGVPFLDIVFQ